GPIFTLQERLGIAFVTDVTLPGGGVERQSISQYHVAPLGVGWYSDWSYNADPDQPADTTLEYVQLIRVGDTRWPPNWAEVQAAAVQRPGSVWMIGNEPECPNQDAVTPAVYAQRYHEAYTRITGWDHTAEIAIGAIVEPTPLRLRWLEKVLQAYQDAYGRPMPVHIWNIHIQILPEGAPTENGWDLRAGAGVPVGIDFQAEGLNPREYTLPDCANAEILKNMVLDFREWMNDHGQRDKALIISEMGVLQPSIYLVEGGSEEERQKRGDRAVELFMSETFTWLKTAVDSEIGMPADENRLVQRWLWFSLNGSFWDEAQNPKGFNGNLYDYVSKKPTRFGIWFMSLQHEYGTLIPFVRKS
ncbi:MAG: hypothetical protein H5T69_07650, partial [Chloroflexi bacterium]|nr:hypothetical protein [Chloroflexota bacterium]